MLLRLSQVDAVWPVVRSGRARALLDTVAQQDAIVDALLWPQQLSESTLQRRGKRTVAPAHPSDGLQAGRRQVSSQAAMCFLVAPSVDALAATRTLTLLLQAESIPYHIYPIHDYRELENLQCGGRSVLGSMDVQDTSPLRAIVCVNCGAGVDIAALLRLPEDSDLPVLVIDSHRPYHLRNLQSAHVILLHDSDVFEVQLPPSGAEDALGQILPMDPEAHVDDATSSDLDTDADTSPQDARNRRRRRRGFGSGIQRAVQRYYRRTERAASAAGVAYALAANLNRADLDTLWYWILAVTEQFFDRQASDTACYEQIVRCIREEWKRIISRLSTDDDNGDGQKDALAPLEPSTEFSLELLRHWTLYDSLIHSTWLASRVQRWRQEAERSISEILALLGIPLRESKQRWTHLAAELKDRVRERLIPVLCTYFTRRESDAGRVRTNSRCRRSAIATTLCYESFVRRFGAHRGQTVSAADVVLAAGALLDRGHFWRAYALLQCRHIDDMVPAFELAKRSQRLLLEAAVSVLERRAYTRGRHAWCAMLDGPPLLAAKIERKLHLQRRLALALGDWFYGTKRHPKPLWLIVDSPQNEHATVTLVTPQRSASEDAVSATCAECDLRAYAQTSATAATLLAPAFHGCEPVQASLGSGSVPDLKDLLTRGLSARR